jgi:hypothetical protein
MRAAVLAASFASFLWTGSAIAQPLLEERLILVGAREPATPEFAAAPPAAPGFQTKITRASIRDHLRDYRVRVRQDGLAVYKRFAFGR